MSVHDEDGRPLRRKDFDSLEGWLRYRHEAGERPFEDPAENFALPDIGHYAGLAKAVYGHNPRQFARAFEDYGVTTGITKKQYERNFRAIALANCLGMVLNTKIDITWQTVGVESDITVAARQRAFLDWLRRWLERRGAKAAWMWVLEVGSTRGLHSHILVHVPSKFQVRDKMKDAGVSGPTFAEQAKKELARIVGRRLVDEPGRKTVLIRHRAALEDILFQWIWFDYRMKGLERSARAEAQRLGQHRLSDQGMVTSKRTGVSRLLDKASVDRFVKANMFPFFTDEQGRFLMDGRFFDWHRDPGTRVVWPNVSPNGNLDRRNSGFAIEPVDVERAFKNRSVS